MPEPGTTAVTGAITNALTAIKDIQLWLLTAIALFLVACLFVPVLSAAVPQEARKFVILGAGAFTILAVCRLGSLVISATNKSLRGLGDRCHRCHRRAYRPLLGGS